MKIKTSLAAFFLAALVSGAFAAVPANEDPIKVAPNLYKVLFENERVRVMQVTFKPGEKIGKHSHPDHYVYVAEGGTLTISKPDGSSSDAMVKPGDVLWISAETHWAQNTGKTNVRLIVNELKVQSPAKQQ